MKLKTNLKTFPQLHHLLTTLSTAPAFRIASPSSSEAGKLQTRRQNRTKRVFLQFPFESRVSGFIAIIALALSERKCDAERNVTLKWQLLQRSNFTPAHLPPRRWQKFFSHNSFSDRKYRLVVLCLVGQLEICSGFEITINFMNFYSVLYDLLFLSLVMPFIAAPFAPFNTLACRQTHFCLSPSVSPIKWKLSFIV